MKNIIIKIKKLTIILIVISFNSCQNKELKKDFIIEEKDLIPEGVALDYRTNIIYVGSTYKRKIIQIDSEGKISDFISQEKDSIWSVLGMEVDESTGILWVNTAHMHDAMPLINPTETKEWMTSVSAFDISKRKLIKKYKLNATNAAFNDLTVTANGNVYTTESANNKIFMINSETDSLELFLELKNYNFPNGITYSEKLNLLFVSTREGVLKINIKSKKYKLLKEKDGVNAKRIDGLAIFKNYLIGHQSSKVSKFLMNEDFTEIIEMETLDSGDEFDSSTTGEVSNGFYYYIINSQLRSGIDFKKKTTKPLDSLEKIIIRKIQL